MARQHPGQRLGVLPAVLAWRVRGCVAVWPPVSPRCGSAVGGGVPLLVNVGREPGNPETGHTQAAGGITVGGGSWSFALACGVMRVWLVHGGSACLG